MPISPRPVRLVAMAPKKKAAAKAAAGEAEEVVDRGGKLSGSLRQEEERNSG